MSQVTIDGALLARLNGLSEQMEFRDESGRLLGHFVPARKGPVKLLPSDGCPYTAEELERMRNQTGGRPLSEIWKRLGVE
jgi:hypothetical protein